MISPKASARYRVSLPLQAVKLEPHPGSTLCDSIIESEGQAAGSGLINVLWEGDASSVFYEDLREKAQILTVLKPAGSQAKAPAPRHRPR